MNWEEERGEEMRSALKKGKLPYTVDEERGGWTPEQRASATPWLMGQVAGAVHEIKPAAEIVNDDFAIDDELLVRGGTDSLLAAATGRAGGVRARKGLSFAEYQKAKEVGHL